MSIDLNAFAAAIASSEAEQIEAHISEIDFTSEPEPRAAINIISTFAKSEIKNGLLARILSSISCIPNPNDFTPASRNVYRACADLPSHVRLHGLTACGESLSIFKHKMLTGSSIYVSTSKSLDVAIEHAKARRFSHIYEISSVGGIDCAKWFFPIPEIHSDEQEVVFPHMIPEKQVLRVANIKDPHSFIPF